MNTEYERVMGGGRVKQPQLATGEWSSAPLSSEQPQREAHRVYDTISAQSPREGQPDA